jgi:hypothetical protein
LDAASKSLNDWDDELAGMMTDVLSQLKEKDRHTASPGPSYDDMMAQMKSKFPAGPSGRIDKPADKPVQARPKSASTPERRTYSVETPESLTESEKATAAAIHAMRQLDAAALASASTESSRDATLGACVRLLSSLGDRELEAAHTLLSTLVPKNKLAELDD